ncbi:MAG: ATP-dependent sacrificial sulfur transferase LarE [Bradymonadaceae bacterium]
MTTATDSLPAPLAQAYERIQAEMLDFGDLVVAFSGGVDSSVVAALAHRALGDDAVAVTAVSETLPDRELEEADEVAREIGIRHERMSFSELEDADFRENTPDRCFFCQSMRFDQLEQIARALGCETLASGTNASDRGEHRPGLRAMDERDVYQPLLAHEIDKQGVRRMARALNLSVWDKPAKACLSSRIPHGRRVTEQRLRRIERAEDILYDRDFRQVRVRAHAGTARIEVAPDELADLLDGDQLRAIAARIQETGFDDVTVDLQGYRTGSVSADPA